MTDQAQTVILARCSRCYRLFARYVTGGQHPPGWWRFARVEHRPYNGGTDTFLACTCAPRPALPEGKELEKLLARARKRSGPLPIRV